MAALESQNSKIPLESRFLFGTLAMEIMREKKDPTSKRKRRRRKEQRTGNKTRREQNDEQL